VGTNGTIDVEFLQSCTAQKGFGFKNPCCCQALMKMQKEDDREVASGFSLENEERDEETQVVPERFRQV